MTTKNDAPEKVADAPTLDMLMTKFIEDRMYCKNVTPATIEYYHKVWKNWHPHLPQTIEGLNRPVLKDALKGLTNRGGLSPVTINIYLRGLNAFLKWLHLEGHTPTLLHLAQIRTEKKAMVVFSEDQVRRVVEYRPKHLWAKRAHALTIFIIDTGARINEALTLTRDQLDLDNMLVLLKGKGRKERIVPISPECRKVVWQWMKTHQHHLVFATSTGTAMSHTNSSRDFKKLCTSLRIEGVRCSWHTLRHTFATHYIKRGGDVFRLKQSLGHSSLAVTQRYVTISTDDLSSVHNRLSLIGTATR